MPEALIKGMMDLSANDADTETIVLPAEEKWGFRLTGGSEFSMPVTVFQVKEGSRAESVGIKLGDSIIRINGIPTAGMSLNEAQRALEYAGDDLRLTLSNFDDDDNDSPPKEMREVILAEPIDTQLRNMQKKLAAISNIPSVIQMAIEEVAKVLEKFIPPEPEVEEPSEDESDYAVTVESLFDESEVMDVISQADWDEEEQIESAEEDAEPEISEEERQRIAKLQRVEKLEKSWPWGDQAKPVHKISNYTLSSSHDIIEKRIKQLNQSEVLSLYKKKGTPS
ncbi:PDZ and LIM domain protein 5-like isoform X2 [Culicoides brevitarsis]|uniref:PDZ and LIM domain protein 5-like isoform X2 n=1 Tax=Culicoides brevitarsis TaxID=469753 RepID=UPI00307B2C3E